MLPRSPEHAPHCPHCRHFWLNYTRGMPMSCRLWEISTPMGRNPSAAVFEATGKHCAYFSEKKHIQARHKRQQSGSGSQDSDLDLRV